MMCQFLKKKKIVTVTSTKQYFEENEDIIKLDIERDEEKHKKEQERVKEIYDVTFETKEEGQNQIRSQ